MVTVMCAAHVGRASDPARSHATQRRLRDTMLVGARATSLFSDADHSAAAASLERLLRAGYRYFEFDVRQHGGQTGGSVMYSNSLDIAPSSPSSGTSDAASRSRLCSVQLLQSCQSVHCQ